MSNAPQDLAQIREGIERIDRDILNRLAERMTIVEDIAQSKIDQAVPFRDPLREEQVFLRVRENATRLRLDPHAIEGLYRAIMEMSIARQQAFLNERSQTPLRVAYQGVEGAYTHLSAQRRYRNRSQGALLVGFETFRDAADAVREGRADVALLPIENLSLIHI